MICLFNYNNILIQSRDKNIEKSEYDVLKIIEKYRVGEYRIVTEQARYPLANLKEIFKDYNLSPDYQRRRVWDNKRKSKLIESFIINVPIPPIFLYEIDFSKYEVMDGLQRISAILDFFEDGYKLEGLELWDELNDKLFSELPEEIKTGIKRRYLSAIILLKESASDPEKEKMMKQFVFARLNTGGMELSPQEIRNALFLSDFNDRLIKMAESNEFRSLWGEIEDDSYKRMEDCELVLRFFSYKSACKHNISKTTIVLLDSYAEIATTFKNSDIDILENLFFSTLDLAKYLFGEKAFKSSMHTKKSEKMIYDAIMLSCAELIEEGYSERLYQLEQNQLEKDKFSWIEKESENFNGKYTAIKIVNERVQLIKNNILSLLL